MRETMASGNFENYKNDFLKNITEIETVENSFALKTTS